MDRSYWQRVVEEAEEEFQAATKPSDVNAAARKLQVCHRDQMGLAA
jgi:hypothetical protein